MSQTLDCFENLNWSKQNITIVDHNLEIPSVILSEYPLKQQKQVLQQDLFNQVIIMPVTMEKATNKKLYLRVIKELFDQSYK